MRTLRGAKTIYLQAMHALLRALRVRGFLLKHMDPRTPALEETLKLRPFRFEYQRKLTHTYSAQR